MKMTGKRLMGLLAALTIAALLCTGCGSGGQTDSNPVPTAASTSAGGANIFDFEGGNTQVGAGGTHATQPGQTDRPGQTGPSVKTNSGGVNKATTTKAAVGGATSPSGGSEERPLMFPKRQGIKGEVVVFLNFTPNEEFYAEFRALYPGVTVKPIVAQWETQNIKLSQQIQSGVYPDYIMSGAIVMSHYLKNYLQPVDPYIQTKAQTMDLEAMKEGATYGGKMYAVLQRRNPYLLYYNTDMFQAAGLKTPYDLWKEDKWTWSALRQYASELTDPDKGIYGFGTDWEQGFLMSAGTGLIKRTGDVQAKLNIDDSLFREALLFYYDGVNKDKIFGTTRWGNLNDFINGKIAMLYTRFGDYETMEKKGMKTYGVAPFPKYNDANGYVGAWESDGWCIGRKAKNPQGGMAFGEYAFNRGAKIRTTAVDRGTFSDEQMAMINSIKKSMDWIDAYGCYDTFYQAFGNFMRRNGDFAALLEENRPIWTRAIQNTIAGK